VITLSRSGACAGCLRRAFLIGYLAPSIAGLLDRPGRRTAGLLSLGEEELIAAIAGRRAPAARRFVDEFDAEAAARQLQEASVGVVCRHGAAYPSVLAELPDPPAALFFTGRERRLCDLLREPLVTVVGTRGASPYAREVAHALGRGLGAAGVTVVSGLALGVDAAAHRGCLDAGGGPLAVLAGGVDVPYPRANGGLYRRVRERGALVSELPPGLRPFRWGFPARNRIMAGLSAVTVVVEAADPSGSLITAAFAEQLGRTVGAVPGRVTARGSEGSNRLLREGAAVIRDPADVIDELFGAGGTSAPADRIRDAARIARPRREAGSGPLEPSLRRVLEAVEAGEDVGVIGRAAGMTAGQVRAALGRLESLDLVRRTGLASYERTAMRGVQ
jgi:DNA processing protein